MTRHQFKALLTAAAAAGGLASCSPLSVFNALVPKDRSVIRIIEDSPYGPHPRQKLDVYRPADARRDLPIIIFFYGGSWSSGDRTGYSWVGRALAARGFVVAIPDYRLVPEARFPAFLEDGAAAVALVRRISGSLGGDGKRLILAGHSAGAYNAAMLAYDERWLGPDHKKVIGFIGLAGPYDFLPISDGATRAAFAGVRDLKATQPGNFVGRGDPPAFIATGDKDRTVHRRNSDSLERRLKAAGIAVTRKTYAEVGHAGLVTAIARPLRHRAKVLDDMTDWAKAVAERP